MDNWIWQQQAWPEFKYDPSALVRYEKEYLQNSGYLLASFQHISEEDRNQIKVDLFADEAVESAAIEGEVLERSSVQASLRRILGLEQTPHRIPPMEQGMADLMIDLYRDFITPLSDEILHNWHLKLMSTSFHISDIGTYRKHTEPMQIVSGAGNKIKVHYEAPPATLLETEMSQFIRWYNASINLPTLTRAGIAHLYFEMIHPYEDGNGRLGRALAEKSIAQSLNHPLISAISKMIQKNKKQYYAELSLCNKSLDISSWLIFFSKISLDAQQYTKQYTEFLVEKTQILDKVKDCLNERQLKVLYKMFGAGIEGFKGGLSAENYIRITQTSRATATRDLQDLVAKNILFVSGARKSTRYHLTFTSAGDKYSESSYLYSPGDNSM